MKERTIHFHISSTADAGRRFVSAWESAKKKKGDPEENNLNFIGMKAFMSTMTAKRWIVLKHLNTEGPMSIRALSKELERDYKSVHGDVTKLMELGLIIKRDDGKIEAPYDRIISDIRMAAA
jgi:predicted transcriptional regulator